MEILILAVISAAVVIVWRKVRDSFDTAPASRSVAQSVRRARSAR